ncbi:MAG: hypothetical protein KF734_06310 [Saprospiraceae bacterium]|nr:hypothetical protein [Saprospiraceae bacterium]
MKHITLIFCIIMLVGKLAAQAPQGINYQAVARNADTSPKVGTLTVGIKIKDALGADLYTESHNAMTNGLGLFNLTIGQGSNPSTPFSNLNWASGSKLLEVIINGQSGGTQPLLSVPYALYAEKTNLQAGNGISVSGNTISNTGDLSNTNEIQTLSVSGNQLSLSNGGGTVSLPTPPSYVPEIYVFEEQYAHGLLPTTASGQQPVGGVFNTRNLNTQVFPTSGGAGNVTIGGSLLTFKPGTYLIDASAPAYFTGRHQLFLRRSDNDVIQLTGTCEVNAVNNLNVSNGTGADQNRSFLKGVLVVPPGSDRVFKLDHYLDYALLPGTEPLGVIFSQPATFWNSIKEVYATITVQKIQ